MRPLSFMVSVEGKGRIQATFQPFLQLFLIPSTIAQHNWLPLTKNGRLILIHLLLIQWFWKIFFVNYRSLCVQWLCIRCCLTHWVLTCQVTTRTTPCSYSPSSNAARRSTRSVVVNDAPSVVIRVRYYPRNCKYLKKESLIRMKPLSGKLIFGRLNF